MSDETRRVLDLLAQGKVTVDEADQLLRAIGMKSQSQSQSNAAPPKPDESERPKPRFILINVHKLANERRPAEDINIRVPFAIVRGGLRLGALIPGFSPEKVSARLRERGLNLDFSTMGPAAIETLLADMGELNIDVDGGKQQVRITCE
jgi:hypothetical protein